VWTGLGRAGDNKEAVGDQEGEERAPDVGMRVRTEGAENCGKKNFGYLI
jgi:hypothetical protein